MLWALAHRRTDGSFVVFVQGEPDLALPYHVMPDDPIFGAVSAAAEGIDLPPEPTLPMEKVIFDD